MVVYLDTETTGLGENAEIIQIGIIDENGKVLIDTLVKCQNEIPFSATEIHGIKKEDLVNAPTWPEVYEKVSYILNNADIVYIYNADYDIRLLRQTSRRYEFDLSNIKCLCFCVMEEYAENYNCGTWEKLVWACKRLNIDIKDIEAHSAVGDCEMTRRLYEKMLE